MARPASLILSTQVVLFYKLFDGAPSGINADAGGKNIHAIEALLVNVKDHIYKQYGFPLPDGPKIILRMGSFLPHCSYLDCFDSYSIV